MARTGADSNKARGDEFRDRIRDICIAAGYDPIAELKVNGKDVDLAFVIQGVPEPTRVAIEAKNYEGNLGKKTIDEIVGSYTNAVHRREIDQVWVIASLDFTAEARDTLRRNQNFFAVPYSEFIRRLINFQKYVEYLNIQIDNDGIREYYVPQRFVGGSDALGTLAEWHSSAQTQPIAILSTYGMGKSSLAKMFAFQLIERYKRDELARIPILIRLGDLAHQHQIDGLLGSLFSNRVNINNFSFPLFQKLNELGHLTLIFDGLDEMRHAMSWDDFRYNFDQLSTLIKPRTKCILLGRPNTFQNKKEYQQIVEGIMFVGDQEISAAGAASFATYDLSPFNHEEVVVFLKGYVTWSLRRQGGAIDQLFVSSRISDVIALDLEELIARPVHTRMIADIATDPKVTIGKLSRFGLYETFIDSVLRRDFERHAGTGITPAQRRLFLRRLAWHLWTVDGKDTFRRSDVGRPLYADLCGDLDENGVARELISGSLIETKIGEVFYFGHRSFYEFLIAEQLAFSPRETLPVLDKRYVSEEVIAFTSENSDITKLAALWEASFSVRFVNVQFFRLMQALYNRLVAKGEIQIDRILTPWHWVLSSVRRSRINPGRFRLYPPSQPNAEYGVNLLANIELTIILFIQGIECLHDTLKTEARRDFLRYIVANTPFQTFLKQSSGSRSPIVSVRREYGLPALITASALSFRRGETGELEVAVDAGMLFSAIVEHSTNMSITSSYVFDLDETLSMKVSDLGPQSDPNLRDLRRLVAQASGPLRFVLADEARGTHRRPLSPPRAPPSVTF